MVTRKAKVEISAVDKTKAGIESAKRNIDSLKNSASGALLRFGAIGAAIGSAIAGASLKGLIDAGDQLAKLSQKTGISAESLSVLRYAGQLAGVEVEDLAKGLNKLAVNMADAARGGKETGAAFTAIGVKVQAAGGHLRNTDEVLGDIADRFASYEDGAEKAAIATALFGKNGAALIPFLNQGRRGLAEMKEEAQRLGIIFSGDLARKSEEFNDNLTRMSALLDGLKMSILPGVVEWLNKMAAELLAGQAAFGGFGRALVGLGLGTSPFTTYGEGARNAREEIERLEASIRRIGPDNPLLAGTGYPEQLKYAQQRLAYFQGQQEREALAAGAGVTDTRGILRTPPKGKAPRMASANAGGEADALRRKQFEGDLKKLQQGLANERDLFTFHNSQLSRLYAEGELSIDKYFDARDAAQKEFLTKQSASIDAEIALLEKYKAKATKGADREDFSNRITEALVRQAVAHREAGQAATDSEAQRTAAVRNFISAVYELDAQLADMAGDEYGAAVLRNAQKLADAAALLAKGGGDPARLVALRDLLNLQTEQARVQTTLAQLAERQAVAEEAYQVSARARGIGLLEQERAIYMMRSASLEQLKALSEQAAALADRSADPRVRLFADQLALTLAKAREEIDPTVQRLNAATDQAADNLARAAEDAIINFGSIRDILQGLGNDLLRLGTQVLVTDPLREAAKGYFKGLTAQTGAADMLRGGPAGPGADAVKTLATSASAGTDALKGMADSLGITSTALAAIPSAAATPLAASFAALTAAAQSAAAALAAVAATGGGGGGGAAGSALAGMFSGAFSSSGAASSAQAAALRAQWFHDGGIVGAGGRSGIVPAGIFTDAPRYHRGGLAGDEVPAILRRGEEVLTAADPRHRDNAPARGGNVYNMNINVPRDTDRMTATQIANRIAARAAFASRRNG